jgi:hydrogenase maturation protein HypF
MKLNSVATSSMGRLFDAVASIAGVRQIISYEAQAAIEFESLAAPGDYGSYAFVIGDGKFDAAPIIEAVVDDILAGVKLNVISARFHRAIANLVLIFSRRLKAQYGSSAVALSGGVYQNVTLLKQTVSLLQDAGFTVYYHRLVPPNDGGLALGQAAVAVARSRA